MAYRGLPSSAASADRSGKAAARQAKKDARLRERKRRLLMKQIEQAKKDAAVLEKYIKRLEKRQSGKDALILQTVK